MNMSRQLLLQFMLITFCHIVSINCNYITCGASSCNDEEQCEEGEDCVIECRGMHSCQNATILCPNNHKCRIECVHSFACNNAIILGATSSELMIKGCMESKTCSSLDIYCPPHNGTSKKCQISGNNNIRDHVHYYAINGFADIQFNYTGDYSVDSSYMYCTSDYAHSCAIADTSFECHSNGDVWCNDATIATSFTTQVYTTSALPNPTDNNNVNLLDLLQSGSIYGIDILYFVIAALVLTIICILCCLLHFIRKSNRTKKLLKQRTIELEKVKTVSYDEKSDARGAQPDIMMSPNDSSDPITPFSVSGKSNRSNRTRFPYEHKRPPMQQTLPDEHSINTFHKQTSASSQQSSVPTNYSTQNRQQHVQFHAQNRSPFQQYNAHNSTTRPRPHSYHNNHPYNTSYKSIQSNTPHRYSQPPVSVEHSNSSIPRNVSEKSIHSNSSNIYSQRWSAPPKQYMKANQAMYPMPGNMQQYQAQAQYHYHNQHVQHDVQQMQQPQRSSVPIHSNPMRPIHMIVPKQSKNQPMESKHGAIESGVSMLTDVTGDENSTTMASSSANSASHSSDSASASDSDTQNMVAPVPKANKSRKMMKIVVDKRGTEQKESVDVRMQYLNQQKNLGVAASNMAMDGSAMTLDHEPPTPSEQSVGTPQTMVVHRGKYTPQSNAIKDNNTPGTMLIHDVDSEASSTSSSEFPATEYADDDTEELASNKSIHL